MAVTNFGLRINAETTGEEKVNRIVDAINRAAAATDNLDKKSERAGEKGFQKFADNAKSFLENPLQSATVAADGFLSSAGKFGLIGGVIAAGMGAAVKASFDLVKSTGDAAEGMMNLAGRTGLSLVQVDKLTAMSKIAGVNIEALEASARTLSATLDDTAGGGEKAQKALNHLGVAVYESSGKQRDMGQVTLDLIEKLSRLESTAERNALATATLGRGAVELLPLIKNYEELQKTAEEIGFGMDEYVLKRLAGSADEIDKLGLRWDLFKRKLAEPATAVVQIIADISEVFGGSAQPGLYAGGQKPRKRETIPGIEEKYDLSGMVPAFTVTGAPKSLDQQFNVISPDEAFRASLLATPEGMKSRLSEITAKIRELNMKLSGKSLDPASRLSVSKDRQGLLAEEATLKVALKQLEDGLRLLEQLGTFSYKQPNNPVRAGVVPSLTRYGQALDSEGRVVAGQRGASVGPLPPGTITGGPLVVSSADITKANAGMDAAKAGIATARLQGEYELFQKSEEMNRRSLDHQIRMLELTAGPGGELAAVEQIYHLRLKAAKTMEERQQAEIEHQQKVAELEKRREEQYRQLASNFYSDLRQRGGRGVRDFATSQLDLLGQQVFTNASGKVFERGGRVLGGIFGNPGGLLSGTMLDPANKGIDVAVSRNTLATEANTAATVALAQALTFGGGTATVGAGGLPVTSPVQTYLGLLGGSKGTSALGRFGLGLGQTATSGAFLSSIRGTDYSISTGPGQATTASALGLTGAAGRAGTLLGGAAAIGAGGYGIYSGIQQGGGRGLMTAAGSGAGLAAGIMMMAGMTGPAAPIVAGVGALLGLGTLLFGDKRQKRIEGLQSEAESRRDFSPTGTSYVYDVQGRSVDYDYRGRMRPVEIHNHFGENAQVVDGPSVGEWIMRHRASVADAAAAAMTGGGGEVLSAVVAKTANGW